MGLRLVCINPPIPPTIAAEATRAEIKNWLVITIKLKIIKIGAIFWMVNSSNAIDQFRSLITFGNHQ